MLTTIYPRTLQGEIIAPSSKSITHRAIICASFSNKQTKIIHPLLCDDTLYTLKALTLTGMEYNIDEFNNLIIKPCKKYQTVNEQIDCGESGSTIRFLAPILTLKQGGISFKGSERLVQRIIDEDFNNFSFNFLKTKNTLTFSKIETINELSIDSLHTSQTVSGYLMASPVMNQNTKVTIKATTLDPYIELTLDVMHQFGIDYKVNYQNEQIIIEINAQNYTSPEEITIEGDYSLSANYLVMGSFGKGLTIKNLLQESKQGDKEIINILKQVGANLTISKNTVTISRNELNPINFDLSNNPDLGPLLFAYATKLNGKSTFTGLKRLIDKESNRLDASIDLLTSLGASISYNRQKDSLTIDGNTIMKGNITLDSFGDHRLIFMLASISSEILNPIKIMNSGAINKSYPAFFKDFKQLGGEIVNEQN